jgi:hypothetical protein
MNRRARRREPYSTLYSLSLPLRFDPARLIAELHEAAIVGVIEPTGSAHLLKGREMLKQTKSMRLKMIEFEVVNETQIEILLAAALRRADRRCGAVHRRHAGSSRDDPSRSR